MYMAIFTHTFCHIAPTKNSNKKGHFPHEIHAKNVLFTYSHQPDSLEMYFSNQPDNLYYQYIKRRIAFTCPINLDKKDYIYPSLCLSYEICCFTSKSANLQYNCTCYCNYTQSFYKLQF